MIRILFRDGSEIDSAELSPGQLAMVEDGLPPEAAISPAERREIWNNQPKKEKAMTTKNGSKTEQVKALRERRSDAKGPKAKTLHPADAAALAGIETATSFSVHLFKDGETVREDGFPNLEKARARAAEMAVGAARRPGVYAISPDGAAHLVPASYGLEAPLAAPKKPAKAAPAKKAAKPAKAAKAAPATAAAKAKASPKADKPEGTSKTEIAVKLLTRAKGASRKEVIEATEWPSINLKAPDQPMCRTP